jgi:hypothetical protein
VLGFCIHSIENTEKTSFPEENEEFSISFLLDEKFQDNFLRKYVMGNTHIILSPAEYSADSVRKTGSRMDF